MKCRVLFEKWKTSQEKVIALPPHKVRAPVLLSVIKLCKSAFSLHNLASSAGCGIPEKDKNRSPAKTKIKRNRPSTSGGLAFLFVFVRLLEIGKTSDEWKFHCVHQQESFQQSRVWLKVIFLRLKHYSRFDVLDSLWKIEMGICIPP